MSDDPASPSPTPPPSQNEVPAAHSTVVRPGLDDVMMLERLARAAAMLAGLKTPPAVPSLVLADAEGVGSSATPLDEGLTVGRENDNDLCFPRSEAMSRHHLRITRSGGHWLLEDLKSSNGTFLFGSEARLQRRLLRDGDIIVAGDVALLFVDPTE